jgi:hypothetical protein
VAAVAIVVVAKVDVDVAATTISVKQAMEVLDATTPGEAAATTPSPCARSVSKLATPQIGVGTGLRRTLYQMRGMHRQL